MGIVIGKTYRFKTYSARDNGYLWQAVTVTRYQKRLGLPNLVHFTTPNGKPRKMPAGAFKNRVS